MTLRLARCSWDDGWVGKHIHSPGGSDETDTPKPRSPEVLDQREDRPFLYVVEDGLLFGCWRRHPVGFRPEE